MTRIYAFLFLFLFLLEPKAVVCRQSVLALMKSFLEVKRNVCTQISGQTFSFAGGKCTIPYYHSESYMSLFV